VVKSKPQPLQYDLVPFGHREHAISIVFSSLSRRLSPFYEPYRSTSLIRNSTLLGPYSRALPTALRWS